MGFYLSVGDHPDPWVRAYGPVAADYVPDCWVQCLPLRTAQLVDHATRATVDGAASTLWHDLWKGFDALDSSLYDFMDQVWTAVAEAETLHLGRGTGRSGDLEFRVYRRVPFLDDQRLTLLDHAELTTHVLAVRDANRQLLAAGELTISVPGWVVEDLGLDHGNDLTSHDVEMLRGNRPTVTDRSFGHFVDQAVPPAGPRQSRAGPGTPQGRLDGVAIPPAPPTEPSL